MSEEKVTESEQTQEETQEETKESQTEETQTEESTPAEDALTETSEKSVEDLQAELEKAEAEKNTAFGARRQEKREFETQIANLNGQIEALKPQEKRDVTVVKSPFDLAAEKAEKQAIEDGLTTEEAEVTFTPKLLREQQAFDAKQREEQTATTTKTQSDAQSNAAFEVATETMNTEAMGEGLDFKTIIEQSGELVTKADMEWLGSKSKSYADFYKRLYDFSVKAIIGTGGTEAKALQAKIKAHSQVKTEEKKPEKKKVPTQKEILEVATTVNEAHINSLM